MPKCSCEPSIWTSNMNLQGSHSEGFLIRTESSLQLFRHELHYMNFGMRLASKNRSPNLEKETFLRLARPLLFQNARNVNSWMGLAPSDEPNEPVALNRLICSNRLIRSIRLIPFDPAAKRFQLERKRFRLNDISQQKEKLLANRILREVRMVTASLESLKASHFELLIPGITELLIPSPSYQFTSTKSLIPSLLLITQSLILTQLIPSQKVRRGHPIPTEHVKRPGY